MDDLISRQAAIAKFEPWLKVEGYSEGELNMLKAVLFELTVMPPAVSSSVISAQTDPCNGCGYLGESCVGEGCGKLTEQKDGEDNG